VAVDLRERLERLDWTALEQALWTDGWAATPPVLRPQECAALVALWEEPRRFRAHVDMGRLRFGEGEYRYFAHPLPATVRTLRTVAYAALAPIANRWTEALGGAERYPPRLGSFLARCRARDQTKPTPLLLRYETGGYNRLHRDLYGDVAFPFQVTSFLSRPGVDYGGGEFLLLESRARCQSRGEALRGEQGQLLIFPNSVRPLRTARGVARAQVRHGVSRVRRGLRFALGVIFHDAR
jgi:hypothetical protein